MFFSNKMEYDYETAPIKRLVPIRQYGLQEQFGGNLYPYIAELKNGLFLVVDMHMKVKSVGAKKDNLGNIDMPILKDLAKENGIPFDWRKTTKDELIKLMTGGDENGM